MRISRFSKRGTEEITFALWEGEKIVDLIVYQKNSSDSKEEAFKREIMADHLDMMAADNAEVTWKELDNMMSEIRAIKVHFI